MPGSDTMVREPRREIAGLARPRLVEVGLFDVSKSCRFVVSVTVFSLPFGLP